MTQRDAFEILKAGHNVFLTGAAGSGKTYLLNEYIRFLKSRGIGIGVTASTGIAATHLGGLTIHSWAGIGLARTASDIDIRMMATKRVLKRFTRHEVLIIDEISMLDANRLDLVDRVARVTRGSFKPFGGMQVVFCGDFFQLPPIAKEGEEHPRFAYHARSWKEAGMKICYLHESYRQGDKEFLEVLNAIRKASVNEVIVSLLQSRSSHVISSGRLTKLYSHNIDVDAENSRELARLPGKALHYRMESRGIPAVVKTLKKGCLAPEVLTLKKGAAVMFVKNNFEKGYVNGTLGVIDDFDELGFPIINAFNGKKFIADSASWGIEENGRVIAEIRQIPLRLAWAITIHKSQGMTLDAAEIDLSDAFEKGMGYVALSRVRSLSGIKLLGFNAVSLQVSPEIAVFDEELRKISEETLREFRAMNPGELTNLQENFIRSCGGSIIGKTSPSSESKNISTYEITLELIKNGLPLAEVVAERNLTLGTIVGHLEKLAAKKSIDPSHELIHLKPEETRFEKIKAAFEMILQKEGKMLLSPAREILGEDFSFEELRIARLFLTG